MLIMPAFTEGKRRREKEREKKLFVSYGSTMRQIQPLINYMLHLHILGIIHYANIGRFA